MASTLTVKEKRLIRHVAAKQAEPHWNKDEINAASDAIDEAMESLVDVSANSRIWKGYKSFVAKSA